jgi:hypothetical protein
MSLRSGNLYFVFLSLSRAVCVQRRERLLPFSEGF